MVSIKFLFACVISCVSALNRTSPCPRLFAYERNTSASNRWYGVVTVSSETALEGVWLRLAFDGELQQLGNWFGEVRANDNNREFVIKNRSFKLEANVPHQVRFYAQYDEGRPVPGLVSVQINAKTVCPDEGVVVRTTAKSSTTAKPNIPLRISDDEDYFIGDFGILNRQQATSTSPLDGCGTVTGGGHETEYPWHASIYYTNGVDLVHICAGNLLSKAYVLTAARCLYKDPHTAIFPDELVVYFGKHNLRSFSSVGLQVRGVSDFVLHPLFNSSTSVHNLALLKLAAAVEVSNYVRAICLWRDEGVDEDGVTVGWGVDQMGKFRPELTRGQLQIASKQLCPSVSADTFCTIFKAGTVTCNADSGGGFFSARGGVWYLRGVLSVVNKEVRCDPLKYLTVTDVSKYLEWIKQFII
ncbi:hypothetical protein PPYR_03210 [Photinus pyralis]|uniref:Peptidase S1 domain-containing protein n=1 Tax=Photinus pyralis TaxID=7054 RepID=A0A1Y1KRK0_PHOPY|nr:chymotrypsin-like protease CTRL-1 [Photinus pyralis]KAB0791410.1 hypothetical protein PPYR_03210 [Photinus pyralis]